MKIRICIFIYCRRINRSNFIKFIYWYYLTRYILCSCPFSLCFIHRSSICYFRGVYSLIPIIYRIILKPVFIKNSIFCNIYWSKFNFFPTTFFRISWNTSTILRLPWFLYFMKYYFISRILYLFISYYIYINYYLRISSKSTNCIIYTKFIIFNWMISKSASCWTFI